MRIIYICLLLLGFSGVQAQQNTGQYYYWPYYTPNGIQRWWSYQTSEDWWYGIQNIPSNHPAYSSGKYVACGYSTYDEFLNWTDVWQTQPCYDGAANTGYDFCELQNPSIQQQHGIGFIATMGIINQSNDPNGMKKTYNYGSGSFFDAIPTKDGGFLAVGGLQNSRILHNTTAFVNESNIPTALKGQPITYFDGVGGSGMFDATSCVGSREGHAAIAKMDANGTLLWLKYVGITPFNPANSGTNAFKNRGGLSKVKEVSDGYVFTGHQILFANSSPEIKGFVGKIDFNGNIVYINELAHGTGSIGFNTWGFGLDIKNANTPNYQIYISGETNLLDWAYPSSTDKEKAAVWKYSASGQPLWATPLELTNGSVSKHMARSISVMQNGQLALGWSGNCYGGDPQGDCLGSYVSIINDNGSSGTEVTRTPLGASVAYDLVVGVGVAATTDGGVAVVGVKKLHHMLWVGVLPYTNEMGNADVFDFSYCNTGYGYYNTDAFVAKLKSDGKIEWTSTFDSKTKSPAPKDPLSFTGNPRNPSILQSWLENPTNYVWDIRRQECLYAIIGNESGDIVIVGNVSSNLDDSYVAVIDHTCNLVLNNHVFQRVDRPYGQTGSVMYIPDYIGSNITTGRETGNTNDIAEFVVTENADVKLNAGKVISMKPGTKITRGCTFKASIDPTHTCTAGPLYMVRD
jgi:hypothetical protein